MRACFGLALIAFILLPAAPLAARVRIDVDTAMADRLLAIACSNAPIDAAEFTGSQALRDQLGHHAGFGDHYSMANYLAGVREIAACRAPDPDPFRFAALVRDREKMRAAIAFLVSRREEIGQRVAAMLSPYVPERIDFAGNVILAAASFSCGGFARNGSFFVDIPCLADDIEGEYEAIVRLIAHETYHAVQVRMMVRPRVAFADIAAPADAHEMLFFMLATEGSASHVATMTDVPGAGAYATFSRQLAARNVGHLSHNFRLIDYVVELLGQPHPDYRRRFEELAGLAFDGNFDQLGYFVGEQMAAEIDHDFGPTGLSCILALPAENFVLGYERALATGGNLDRSTPLAPATVAAARRLAAGRGQPVDLDDCLRPVPAS